jgi:uncharacterized protein (TIGR02271 family)
MINDSKREYSDDRPVERDEQTVQLREEELEARKRSVETGQVRIGKDVIEEQQTLQVPVTREEAFIERHPVDRRPADGGIGESDDTIRVPLREEQVSVDKRAVVTEEINVGKRQIQETEQVTGTVRREEARIREDGDMGEEEKREQHLAGLRTARSSGRPELL